MEIVNYLTECVKNNIPVSFSKYGDGECNCMFHRITVSDSNCDKDTYSLKLSESLLKSFKYIVDDSDNNYIGKWPTPVYTDKFNNLVTSEVKWVYYNSLIFDENNDENKAILYKTIKESKLKKIMICNKLLIKNKILLNIDEHVIIPFNSWFDDSFEEILNTVKNLIGSDGNHIVMTSCGMSAKVLICELKKIYPKGIYLDIGSGLDKICTKRESRGWKYNYEYLTTILKDCLPDDWEDSKYNELYSESSNSLGLHLPK